MIVEVQHQAPKNLEVQKTAGATQVQTIDRWWTSLCAETRSHQLKFRRNVPVVMQRQDTTIQNIQMIRKIHVTKDAMRHEAVEMPVGTQRHSQTIQLRSHSQVHFLDRVDDVPAVLLLNDQSETSGKRWFSSAMNTQSDEGADASVHLISSTTREVRICISTSKCRDALTEEPNNSMESFVVRAVPPSALKSPDDEVRRIEEFDFPPIWQRGASMDQSVHAHNTRLPDHSPSDRK